MAGEVPSGRNIAILTIKTNDKEFDVIKVGVPDPGTDQRRGPRLRHPPRRGHKPRNEPVDPRE